MGKLDELARQGTLVPITVSDLPEILTEALELATDWSEEEIKAQVSEVMDKVNDAVKEIHQ